MLADPVQSRAMRRALAASSGPRPTRQLLKALLDLAGGQAELLRHTERPWASATFSGARHTVTLAFSGDQAVEAGERFAEMLGEHEFTLPGQLVADAAVTSLDHNMLPGTKLTVEAELLLLEDG